MTDGIILIDKPAGMTSFGVVARVRRVLSRRQGKKVKVGHTGTLDPFATGLMILVVGKECKNAGTYTKLDKVYEATFMLGQVSTTGDPEGEITTFAPGMAASVSLEESVTGACPVSPTPQAGAATCKECFESGTEAAIPSQRQIEATLQKFTGTIQQRPPIFSAIKVNGQRAYKLARDGKEVEIPLRNVDVYSLELIEYEYPYLKIRTHVSSGTYIRSLAVDIGRVLGTGAYCQQLRRTSISTWSVEDAKTLADFGVTD
jgi:tRNA pseudouridine55 synthase